MSYLKKELAKLELSALVVLPVFGIGCAAIYAVLIEFLRITETRDEYISSYTIGLLALVIMHIRLKTNKPIYEMMFLIVYTFACAWLYAVLHPSSEGPGQIAEGLSYLISYNYILPLGTVVVAILNLISSFAKSSDF